MGGIDEDKRATLRQFAAAGAALSGGVVGTAAADDETKDALVGYLTAHPGVHFSKLRDDLTLGTGETQYHLRQLVDAGTIVTEKDGDYRRYYPAGQFSAFERRALGWLRRETPQAIVLELLVAPTASASTIAAAVGVADSTIRSHVTALADAGVLERTTAGYRVKQPETVITLVVRYADSLGDRAVAFGDRVPELIEHAPADG